MGKRRYKHQRADECPLCLYRNTQRFMDGTGKCLGCGHTWTLKGPKPPPREMTDAEKERLARLVEK